VDNVQDELQYRSNIPSSGRNVGEMRVVEGNHAFTQATHQCSFLLPTNRPLLRVAGSSAMEIDEQIPGQIVQKKRYLSNPPKDFS
jgi:hypothetical protein